MSSAPTEQRWRGLTRSLAFRLGVFYLVLFFATFAVLLAASARATSVAVEQVERALLQRELAERRRRADEDPLARAPTHMAMVTGDVRWVGFGTLAPARRGTVFMGVMTTGLSRAWREATLRELQKSYAWILGGAALLGVLGGIVLTRRALRPVRELAATAQRVVREGDFGARVPRRGSGDELDRLAACFNEMLAHNERLVRGMRDALDHVAHDLRTPLTRLRATAELSLREGSVDAQREALADVVEESDRVLVTLRALTDITEAESGAMRLERRPIELDAVVREVIDLYAHVAEEAGVALRAELGEPVVVSADRVRIAQAVANLVDNAIKYTRDGGSVVVSARREGERAIVSVRDTGIGIPGEALPRIWERLYRADPSRSQRGLGLGLSFVKAIATAHGGEVGVESAPGRGSLFELCLPACDEARARLA